MNLIFCERGVRVDELKRARNKTLLSTCPSKSDRDIVITPHPHADAFVTTDATEGVIISIAKKVLSQKITSDSTTSLEL